MNQIIPKGYKQTEIGVIPEDWVVNNLKGIAPLQRGFDLPASQLRSGTYPVVYSNGILNFHNKAMVKAPGVVTGRSGTIGKVNYIEKDFWPHNTTLWVTNFKGNDEKYIYFLYSYLKIERFGTGSGVPTLNRNDVHDFQVGIPKSKIEQTAIAVAISDTDALIEKVGKLIEKKKNIKQGVMQELLTGKKRIPGFNDEWEVQKIGQIAAVVGGGTPSTYNPNYWNGTINWFTPTEIGLNKYTYGSLRKISKEGLNNCSAKILPKGTVLLTSRAGIGDMSILMNEGCTNQGFQSLIANNDTSHEFLYYLVSTLKNVLIQNASGSTFLEISPNKIKQIEVKIPNFKEQIAIANVLSDMDLEIDKLKSELTKYKNLKQGMMQNLLTGKIRLIKK